MRFTPALLLLALAACKDDGSAVDSQDPVVVDVDGDGFSSDVDCDDEDAAINPEADELCDGIDNDCDGDVDGGALDAGAWYADGDLDGYGGGDPVDACEAPEGSVAEGGDCDDADAAYNPGAVEDDCTDPNDYNCDGSVGYADADGDGFPACEDCDDGAAAVNRDASEVCDGYDNDCDGLIDDGDDSLDLGSASAWYADADGDSYGDPASTTQACELPAGHVDNTDDCDDSDAAINPAAAELCDGVDNDCDGTIDGPDAQDPSTWYADSDGDGFGDPSSTSEACDAPSGAVSDSSDCDDGDGAVNPDATEVCDGVDNDCDGSIDGPDAQGQATWYADSDGDGYGDPGSMSEACDAPSGAVSDSSDCDDGDGAVNPAAAELCDGVDNDCDGDVDGADATDLSTWYADSDGDGYGDASSVSEACDAPSGAVSDSSDCDDSDSASYPGGAEVCDGADNDCNGAVDDLSSGVACSGETCLSWLQDGYTTSGVYSIDPAGSGTAVDAYCDMDSDGGGWTLMAWTEDSTVSPLGVPYPSLAQCATLDCARGSSGDVDTLNALINLSGEVGIGHTTTAISLYQDLEDYEYSGKIDYGSLYGFYLDPQNPAGCDSSGFATGTFTSISGPTDHDGTTLYLAQSFRYTSSYGNFDESTSYIWLLGTTSSTCGGSGAAPAVYLGNWSASEREYGPYLSSTAGARAVYVR